MIVRNAFALRQSGVKMIALSGGMAKASKTPQRQRVHSGAKSGEVTALARGAMRDTCENQAAESGSVTRFEAEVSASASRMIAGSLGSNVEIQRMKSDANRRIPSVDPAESAKETERAVNGSNTMKTIIQSASALSA